LADLALVEEFLSTLTSHRFTDQQAAAAYPTFFCCVLGLLRINTANTADPPAAGKCGSQGTAPVTERLRSSLSEDHSREDYEYAVEALLERMERSLAS